MQNAHIERKNGSMRRELLDAYLFDSLKEVRSLCADYQWDYNHERPHKALGYLSPIIYAEQQKQNSGQKADESTEALSINPRRHGSPKAADAV